MRDSDRSVPKSLFRVNQPPEPSELSEPDAQEHEGEHQPQTAALPCGSGATEAVSERFVGAAHDALFQAPEFEAAKDRKRQADGCRW
jgi:hypothetical protein